MMVALPDKTAAALVLHRTGALAEQAVRPKMRANLRAEVREAIQAIQRLEEPRSALDLTDPNAVVHACLDAGVSVAALEEALRLARFQLRSDRIAR